MVSLAILPPPCNFHVKSYSDTKKSKRIDAEYYQLKYDEIVKTIKSCRGGWDTLGNLVTIKKSIEVGGAEYIDEGIPFVRVSNITPFDVTEGKYISKELYADLKKYQPKKGEILLNKDATPGIAHHLRDDPMKMIVSGGILRLQVKTDKVNNDYLTLVLNSILIKEQVNRDVGGSIILHWRPEQVKDLVIPILSDDKQIEIQQKITESFTLRKQSKILLELTKEATDIAIEQDTKTAICYLEEKLNAK